MGRLREFQEEQKKNAYVPGTPNIWTHYANAKAQGFTGSLSEFINEEQFGKGTSTAELFGDQATADSFLGPEDIRRAEYETGDLHFKTPSGDLIKYDDVRDEVWDGYNIDAVNKAMGDAAKARENPYGGLVLGPGGPWNPNGGVQSGGSSGGSSIGGTTGPGQSSTDFFDLQPGPSVTHDWFNTDPVGYYNAPKPTGDGSFRPGGPPPDTSWNWDFFRQKAPGDRQWGGYDPDYQAFERYQPGMESPWGMPDIQGGNKDFYQQQFVNLLRDEQGFRNRQREAQKAAFEASQNPYQAPSPDQMWRWRLIRIL